VLLGGFLDGAAVPLVAGSDLVVVVAELVVDDR
jgi:hypothetical protein